MKKKKYPRVQDKEDSPIRELTNEEKEEFDSLTYKYGKTKAWNLFFEDFFCTHAPKHVVRKNLKEEADELELIRFYQKPKNSFHQQKETVKKLFRKHNVPLSI